jgi:type I thyroxine 5'-deiodinase
VPALNKLNKEFGDRAAFYVVYIQEAHPIDGWVLETNVKDKIELASTRTLAERMSAAGSCVKNLGIEIPALIDGPDDGVERAYTAWPDRLYVIDLDGRIAYKSGAGPFGFKPPEVESALKRLLPPAAAPAETPKG